MKTQYFKKLNDIPEIERYSDILPVFATQEYADYLKDAKKYYTIWYYGTDDQDVRFIIPFAVWNKFNFKIGMFLTATICINENIDIDAEREFLNSIIEIIKQKRMCDWIQQPPNWALFRVVPSNSIYCEFGTYRIDLQNYTEEELFNRIESKAKKEIRRATSNEVIIKRGFENLNDALKVFSDIAARENMNYANKCELEKLSNHLPDSTLLYVSYYDNIPQSAVIFISNKFCKYGLYSGTKSHALYGANYLLRWQAIKDAKNIGVKYFDFVGARINPIPGSKLEKIQRFKRQFAGELSKGFLWKMPINKFKYKFYEIIVRTKFFLKGKKYSGDIIDQELKRI